MDFLTRRRFLLASAVVGGGALAAGAGVLGLTDLLRSADRRATGPASAWTGDPWSWSPSTAATTG